MLNKWINNQLPTPSDGTLHRCLRLTLHLCRSTHDQLKGNNGYEIPTLVGLINSFATRILYQLSCPLHTLEKDMTRTTLQIDDMTTLQIEVQKKSKPLSGRQFKCLGLRWDIINALDDIAVLFVHWLHQHLIELNGLTIARWVDPNLNIIGIFLLLAYYSEDR